MTQPANTRESTATDIFQSKTTSAELSGRSTVVKSMTALATGHKVIVLSVFKINICN